MGTAEEPIFVTQLFAGSCTNTPPFEIPATLVNAFKWNAKHARVFSHASSADDDYEARKARVERNAKKLVLDTDWSGAGCRCHKQ